MRSVERSKFRRTFFVGKVIIYTSIFFIIGVVALLFFARSEEVVIARGMVDPRFDYEVHGTDPGVLVDVKFRGGESVKAGELMAQLDDKKLRDEMMRQKNQVVEAEAQLTVGQMKVNRMKKDPVQSEQLRFARSELEMVQKEVQATHKEMDRMESLLRQGVASQAEYDAQKMKLDQAEGKLKTAQEKAKILDLGLGQDMIAEAEAELNLQAKRLANLKEEMQIVEANVERCTIKAPVAGEVVYSAKKPGEAVTPGELLFIIAQGSDAEINAYVDESQIHKVALGQPVRIYPTSFDYREYGEAEGTVTEISPYAKEVEKVHQFWVRIIVNETPLPLKFGSSVTAHIIVRERGLLDMLLHR